MTDEIAQSLLVMISKLNEKLDVLTTKQSDPPPALSRREELRRKANLDFADAAEYLGVGVTFVKTLKRRKKIGWNKKGRLVQFPVEELDLYEARTKVRPKVS